MARGEKYVKLFHPETGTPVEVTEDRAEILKDRGYLSKAPARDRVRRPSAKSTGDDNSAELAAKDAEIERLRAELEAAKAPADGQQK